MVGTETGKLLGITFILPQVSKTEADVLFWQDLCLNLYRKQKYSDISARDAEDDTFPHL